MLNLEGLCFWNRVNMMVSIEGTEQWNRRRRRRHDADAIPILCVDGGDMLRPWLAFASDLIRTWCGVVIHSRSNWKKWPDPGRTGGSQLRVKTQKIFKLPQSHSLNYRSNRDCKRSRRQTFISWNWDGAKIASGCSFIRRCVCSWCDCTLRVSAASAQHRGSLCFAHSRCSQGRSGLSVA